jgi:hypothetical protein
VLCDQIAYILEGRMQKVLSLEEFEEVTV